MLRPIKYRDPTGSERLHTVLSFLCLRRTKDIGEVFRLDGKRSADGDATESSALRMRLGLRCG